MNRNTATRRCHACHSVLPADFRFCGCCGALLDYGAKESHARNKNERRDVAVLFADVSGFTAMCEKMDPEEVFTLMNQVFEGLGHAINLEGGHIDKYIGDNVMALFGAPIAHEDDPARACRAGMGMQRFLNEFAQKLFGRTGVMLKMRIGINCGLVLAGFIGSDVKREYSVLGDTVNLASRLESKAPPGGVLISESIARRIKGFELGPPQELTVKGKQHPVTAFELIGVSQGAQRRQFAETPFVGRTREIAALKKLFTRKKRPFPCIQILGEPGIGKSRLLTETLRAVGTISFLAGTGSGDMLSQPFSFLRRVLQDNLPDLARQPNLLTDQGTFHAFLLQISAQLEVFSPALWFFLAPDDRKPSPPDPDPSMLRRTTESGLEHFLDHLAARFSPLVILGDALEAADSASQAFLGHLTRRPKGPPCPLFVSGRKPLEDWSFTRTFSLAALGLREATSFLASLLPEEPLTEDIKTDLLTKAAGNPMYLEEFTRWATQTHAPVSSSGGSLPPSLRALLVSQLDQLSPLARDFLGGCSIQGLECDVAIAAQAVGLEERHMSGRVLPDLQRVAMLFPLSAERRGTWIFRQPLLQEVVYETLLHTDRQRLHLATGGAFIRRKGDESLVPPETLAYHFERAEAWEPSVRAKNRAGLTAQSSGFYREAGKWFDSALADLHHLGVTDLVPDKPLPPALTELAWPVFYGLAQVRMKTGDMTSATRHIDLLEHLAAPGPQKIAALRLKAGLARNQGNATLAETLFVEAARLAESLPHAAEIAPLYPDFAEHLLKRGRFQEALEIADRFRLLIATDSRGTIQADTLEGKIRYAQGDFPRARTLFLQAQSKAQEEPGLSERARAANNLGNVERDLGNYPQARRHFLDALRIWEKTGDVEGMAGANNNLGNLAMSQGDLALAEKHHEETLRSWQTTGNITGAALSQANLAILALERGNGDKAIGYARDAQQHLRSGGNELLLSLVTVIEGEGLLLSGAVTEAEQIFSAVMTDFDPQKARLAHAGAQRGLGRVLLQRQALNEALITLQEARERFVSLKRAQEAARTSLWIAETLKHLGRIPEARDLLLQARKEFAVMKAARDLERTDHLLASLENPAEVSRS